jgi:hypothetical protein
MDLPELCDFPNRHPVVEKAGQLPVPDYGTIIKNK